LGVVVLVVVVVLALDVTSSSADREGDDKARVAEASGKTAVVDSPIAKTRRGSAPVADSEGVPADDSEAGEGGDGTVEYVKDDGTVVRDHRAGSRPPMAPRPVKKPTLLKIRNDIRPLVKECGKALRQRDSSIRGKIQTDMTVSIKGDRIKVESLDLQVQGLEDSEYTTCVRGALEGLELYAPDGQDDVERHTMSFPFSVP
jgi:hypothetical protein